MIVPDPSRSDLYAPRRLNAFGRGYSLFVRALKYLLLVIALGVTGLLLLRLSDKGAPILADLPAEERTTPGQIELVGAKYEGFDEEGRAYSVTATRAIRAMDAPDKALFDEPMADIALDKDSWVAVKAVKGSLDSKTGLLILEDDVRVYTDDGYEMLLKGLEVDLKKRTAKSSAPVRAQGPMGTIAAQNLNVTKAGNVVTFGGPAVLTIYKLSSKDKG